MSSGKYTHFQVLFRTPTNYNLGLFSLMWRNLRFPGSTLFQRFLQNTDYNTDQRSSDLDIEESNVSGEYYIRFDRFHQNTDYNSDPLISSL